jgi:hypothetical protein
MVFLAAGLAALSLLGCGTEATEAETPPPSGEAVAALEAEIAAFLVQHPDAARSADHDFAVTCGSPFTSSLNPDMRSSCSSSRTTAPRRARAVAA